MRFRHATEDDWRTSEERISMFWARGRAPRDRLAGSHGPLGRCYRLATSPGRAAAPLAPRASSRWLDRRPSARLRSSSSQDRSSVGGYAGASYGPTLRARPIARSTRRAEPTANPRFRSIRGPGTPTDRSACDGGSTRRHPRLGHRMPGRTVRRNRAARAIISRRFRFSDPLESGVRTPEHSL